MGDSQRYALNNSPQIAKKISDSPKFSKWKIFFDIVEKQFCILYVKKFWK